MAHKTFISYKHSESTKLRDDIIRKLGRDADFYKGENGFSEDLSSLKAATIKNKLSDMIITTTVMIVIISPNMKKSNWMEWEIKYALRDQSRNGRSSHPVGIICVVQKQTGVGILPHQPYQWATTHQGQYWDLSKFFPILVENMQNKKYIQLPINKVVYERLSPHYVDIVTEDEFLKNPKLCIDNAFEKSKNIYMYNIKKI